MGMISEFKDFALKGNLVDMAVGLVVGGAFAGIVKSFMTNIVSPLIGMIAGVPDLSYLALELGGTMKDADGNPVPAKLMYGSFLQTVFDFLIVAIAIFIAVKIMNSIMKKAEEVAKPSAEVQLLTEIRDSLAK